MARFDNSYSRFVAMAKLVLPLASLALLATLFLFARSDNTPSTIPFAKVDLETLAREQRLEAPSFVTVTADGSELSFSAELVRPDLSEPDVINAEIIHGQLKFPDFSQIQLSADNGVINGPARLAELSGNVKLTTSSGYTIETDQIATLLDISKIESPGSVVATGPSGDLVAGALEITQNPQTKTYQLVFKNGVKLVYQP